MQYTFELFYKRMWIEQCFDTFIERLIVNKSGRDSTSTQSNFRVEMYKTTARSRLFAEKIRGLSSKLTRCVLAEMAVGQAFQN